MQLQKENVYFPETDKKTEDSELCEVVHDLSNASIWFFIRTQ